MFIAFIPTETLIQDCGRALQRQKRIFLVSFGEGAAGGEYLLKKASLSKRIAVLDAARWFTLLIYKQGRFDITKCYKEIVKLVARYNKIVASNEGSPDFLI